MARLSIYSSPIFRFDLSRHSRTKPDQPNLTGGNKIDKAKTPSLYANRSAKKCPFRVCAVQRRRFPVGANPTRQPLQPEATGAVMEETKCLKPSVMFCLMPPRHISTLPIVLKKSFSGEGRKF
jgi:hypothetical protein